MKKISSLFAFFLLIEYKTALATTIVPFLHLGELAQSSDAVLVVQALEPWESNVGQLIYEDFKFNIKTVVKGSFNQEENIVVRPFSYKGPDISVRISGDFQPAAGKTYLLFLNKHRNHWRAGTMSYYALEEKRLGLERYWIPTDEALTFGVAPRSDGKTPERLGVYRYAALITALKQYLDNPAEDWDGSAVRTALTIRDFIQERSLPAGCDFSFEGDIARWFNDAVNIYYDPIDAPADAAAIVSGAVNVLSNSYTGILPFYAGILNYTNLCAEGTAFNEELRLFLIGVNSGQSALVFFNDPCNEIPNLIVNMSGGCSGTLALGGSWAYTPTALYDGQQWMRSGQGFVVVNENATDCSNFNSIQLLTHELTHAYSMGHLDEANYPGQNMNPICCNPIGSKDIQCMDHVYLSPLPVEVTRFDAEKWRNTQAILSWSTASEKNNDYFFVERSADGLRFERVVVLKGKNASRGADYTWIDEHPFPGQNYYRLNQVDLDGSVYNHGIRAVRIGDARSGLEVYPNPVQEEAVKMITEFDTAYEGLLEIADVSGRILVRRALQLDKGTQITEINLPGLPAGVYWLRLNDGRNPRVQKFINP